MLYRNSTTSLANFATGNPAFGFRDCELHRKDLQSPINETDVSSGARGLPVLESSYFRAAGAERWRMVDWKMVYMVACSIIDLELPVGLDGGVGSQEGGERAPAQQSPNISSNEIEKYSILRHDRLRAACPNRNLLQVKNGTGHGVRKGFVLHGRGLLYYTILPSSSNSKVILP